MRKLKAVTPLEDASGDFSELAGDIEEVPADVSHSAISPQPIVIPTFLYHENAPSLLVKTTSEYTEAQNRGYAPLEAMKVTEAERRLIQLRG